MWAQSTKFEIKYFRFKYDAMLFHVHKITTEEQQTYEAFEYCCCKNIENIRTKYLNFGQNLALMFDLFNNAKN